METKKILSILGGSLVVLLLLSAVHSASSLKNLSNAVSRHIGLAQVISAGPTFSNIQLSNITTTSATVTWTTSVPATSQVLINDSWAVGTTINQNYQPLSAQPEPQDSRLLTSHSVTLTNLQPNYNYTLDVAGYDASGNGASSGQFDSGGYMIGGYVTLTTSPINTSATTDFRMDFNSGKNIFAGSDLYIGYGLVILAGNYQSGNWWTPIVSTTGLPSSITTHIICSPNNDPSNESADSYSGGQCGTNTGTIRIRTSANTPPGTYTAAFTTQVNGVNKVFNYTFNVLSAPAPVVKQAVASIPPIPGLSTWEADMKSLGQKWCDWANANDMGFGVTQEIWYYDGARVFMQVGDYTKDPQYLTCAEKINSQYANYAGSGYREFPFGLMMHYLRYGDDASKQALTNMYNNAANNFALNGDALVWGGVSYPYGIREMAYAVDTMIAAQRLNLPNTPSPFLPIAVDGLIADLDQLNGSNSYQLNQMFMQGLAAEALTEYYNTTKDPRIPPVIKKMLDWIWNNAADHQTGALSYAYLYVGPEYLTDLNNMVAPAYAWYWNITGDPTYLQEGDLIFSHALDNYGGISFSGKEYSENYKWSFDYVRYRSGNPISTVDPADPFNAPAGSTPPPPLSDTSAPSVPTGLSGVALSSSSVSLTWTQSSDNVGVAGYNIYKGGIKIGTSLTPAYLDSSLTASTRYTYTVSAYDAVGNTSAQSSGVTVTTLTGADTSAPTTPTSLSALPASPTEIDLGWSGSSDNIGVAGYKIYRKQGGGSQSQIAQVTNTSFNDASLAPATAYDYTVAAYDAAGNVSTQSVDAPATTLPSTVSQAPVLSNITASNVTINSATISWTTDVPATTQVFYGQTTAFNLSTPINTTLSNVHTVQLTNLSKKSKYYYRVSSASAAGLSSTSTTLSFQTKNSNNGRFGAAVYEAASSFLQWVGRIFGM